MMCQLTEVGRNSMREINHNFSEKPNTWQVLAEHARDLVILIDNEGQIEAINRAIPGMEAIDLIGTSFFDLLAESDRKRFRFYFLDALQSGVYRDFEVRGTGPFRLMSIYSVRITPCFREGGLRGAVLAFRDIVTEKSAQSAFVESEKRLRQMLDGAPDAMLIINGHGRVVENNLAACDKLLCSKEELIGKDVEDFLAQGHISKIRELLEKLPLAKPFRTECLFRKNNKVYFPVEVSICHIDWNGGPHLLLIARDISKRKAAEEALLKKQLEELTSEKEETISLLTRGIAHDFNNLLTVMLSSSELGIDINEIESENGQLFNNLRETALKARDLIRRLSQYGHREKGLFEEVNLNQAVYEFLEMFRTEFPANMVVRLDLDETLPGIYADPTQLLQMIMNLALNARDAMPSGGEMWISSRLHENLSSRFSQSPYAAGRWVELVVGDSGVGMSKEQMEKVYMPFFSTKGKGKGRGLGLAVVRNAVQAHQGEITLESTEGLGSTFSVFLPVRDGEIATAPDRDGKDKTALFLDLSGKKQTLLRGLLRVFNYRLIHMKANGNAAAEVRNLADELDLLILDNTGPAHKDHHLSLEELARHKPDLPVIMLTGSDHLIPAVRGIQRFSKTFEIPTPTTITNLNNVLNSL